MITAINISAEINSEALKSAISAVEENNKDNDAGWSDWEGAVDVADVYQVELCPQGLRIVQRAIDSNGESLKVDLPAVQKAVWGQVFAGSFWDRQ
jgi:hypothetical protein